MAVKLVREAVRRFEEAKLGAKDVFACFAASFSLSSFIYVLSAGGDFCDLSYVRQTPVYLYALIVVFAAAVILSLSVRRKSVMPIKLFLGITSLSLASVLCISEGENVFFALGIAAVLLLIAKYIFEVPEGSENGKRNILKKGLMPKMSPRVSLWITVGIFLLFFAVVSCCTVMKYMSFRHSTFDFGIFCQMFEQMAKTGAPMTTVERSKLLSHFAVHFSPVFYLLLPGYMIFRSPVYLLLAQAAAVGAGVFPVRRICRTLGMSEETAVTAAAVYCLYPTMANGCFYDFHENKFLAVFILYMIAFALENKRVGVIVFALLTLSVKEDAFIYVLAVCIWMLVTKRDRLTAALLAAASVSYFFFACSMIQLSGGEIMSGRFSNFCADANGGLLSALKTCFLDVGYLVREVFSGADTEAFSEITYGGQKLEFVLWTATPLLFAPFFRKRSGELVLLIPLLVINLMPQWMYQFNIDFQYTYGTAAMMIASAMMYAAEAKKEREQLAFVCTMLAVSLVFCLSAVSGKAYTSVEKYISNADKYEETAAALESEIPREKDVSVTAYGYMMPHLYYVNDLHSCPEYYAEYEKTDYYVIDKRYEDDGHTRKMYEAMGDDYELVCEKGYVKIYSLKGITDQ